MMTCDTMVRLVLEMYVAARISHQTREATYGTEF